MSEELKLLPCPNDCKHGLVNVFEYLYGNLEEGRDLYQVACACGVRGPMKDSRKAAVAAWNALPRKLRFSREKPTQDGKWYWYRDTEGEILGFLRDGCLTSSCGIRVYIDNAPGEFASPFPEPSEEAI